MNAEQLNATIRCLRAKPPGDAVSRLQLAQALHSLAAAIEGLSLASDVSAEEHYATAVEAALDALALAHPQATATLRARGAIEPDIRDESSGQALYWFAVGTAARAQARGYAAVLIAAPTVHAALMRALELAPSVDDGGPDRALSAIAAHPPLAQAQDLERARTHLERATAAGPKRGDNALAYLQHYAVPAQDRARALALLAELRAQEPGTLEQQRVRALAERWTQTLEEHFE